MTQKLINLTSKPLTFVTAEGMQTIHPSGHTCRCKVDQHVIRTHAGVPVYQSVYGPVEGLPEPAEGVIYVVPTVVLHALEYNGIHRQDVAAPGTGANDNCLREGGRVVAATRLVQLWD